MKYLVTGAAGFIGASLSERLARTGNKVFGIDNFNSYYSPSLKELRVKTLLSPKNVVVQKVDLLMLDEIRRVIQTFQPDVVIHLAAQPGVRTPMNESFRYIQNNLAAFGNIIQAATEAEIPEFLYASSSSVYGNSASKSHGESDLSIRPISIYGATKLANEVLAPTYVFGSKTRARALRFFTVYGPWGRPDMAYFRIISSVINGTPFTRFGDGDLRRDFTFIDDITEAVEKLAIQLSQHEEGYSDVVNIGGGMPYSLNELAHEISEQMGSKPSVVQSTFNPNDTQFTLADTSRLQQIIGSAPKVSLKEGIQKTIEWANNREIRSSLKDWALSTN